MNLKAFAKNSLAFGKAHLPEILTGVGIAGVICTAFFSGKGCLEADKKIKELEKNGNKLDQADKLAATYKYYIPAVVTGVGTIGCIIGANRLSAKQLAAAMTLATTANKALQENREKIQEVFGDKGLRKVDEKINEEHAARYFGNTNSVYQTGKGDTLCCEGFLTGTLFRASREWVRKCVNDFNARLIAGEHLCYNDFIQMLIPDIDISILPNAGEVFGYNLDVRRTMLEIVEDSFLTYDSSEPGYIFNLRELPLLNYTEQY